MKKPVLSGIRAESEEKKMKKYMITTCDGKGGTKTLQYTMDMTTPEFIHHMKTQLLGKCIGITTVCRVFANGKYGKQYRVF